MLVDAGYLFQAGGQLISGGGRIPQHQLTLDIPAFTALIRQTLTGIGNRPLLRIYWYDATPPGGLTRQHRLIADSPYLKLRLGYLNSNNQQKGVDPLLITDMITLARNHACDDMLLLAGDGDLVVGVTQAQEHGAQVHLLGIGASRGNQAPQLRQEVDECHYWDVSHVQSFLTYTPPAPAAVPVAAAPGTTVVAALSAPGGSVAPLASPAPPSASPTSVLPLTPMTPAVLQQVAAAVELTLTTTERAQILGALTPGRVPGEVDRRLFGTAKQMLGAFLNESEKRLLRRLLYDACLVPPAATPLQTTVSGPTAGSGTSGVATP
ncbi:NYN domain-containing protein [Gemmatimonas sp.]|uniref:NYN domain-containing protein n=1 Tax=Gemmatimonas sp. TaxID=1962908 RepID=UPI0025BECC00|nr:NYN domain-containing protein [Gemmatimonas sp.]MCA2982692.1 NYN domain-containing protein [Gemmatimonas sp.]MCA2995930.1 NYN domain-containing protein [Gemmatimonas sp.]